VLQNANVAKLESIVAEKRREEASDDGKNKVRIPRHLFYVHTDMFIFVPKA
jgi:hypothetical protein